MPVQELALANGMRFLLVDRPELAVVHAGWVLEVGSADDPRDGRGLGHLLEHVLFQGTETIGTRSWTLEQPLRERFEELQERQRKAREARPGSRAARKLPELARELQAVQAELDVLLRRGELSLLYSEAGGTGLNAHAFKDFTMHFVSVPAEKLELWFWLESDRLLAPVVREVEREVRVVRQEYRQRVESVPTGLADLAVEARYWGNSPYAHKPLGNPDEVSALSPARIRSFLSREYRPGRLTAVLVGPVGKHDVAGLAETYFGRLGGSPATTENADNAGEPASHPTGTFEVPCPCPDQVRIFYPTVALSDPDTAALQVLAGVLNGRSGRLFRHLVEPGIAFRAAAQQQPYRHAGFFLYSAETTADSTVEDLIASWDAEVAALQAAPPADDELERVRNQLAANAYRRLQDPSKLRTQLLVYAGLGRWQTLHLGPARLLAVQAGDVRRAAVRYLAAERRFVGVYRDSRQPAGAIDAER